MPAEIEGGASARAGRVLLMLAPRRGFSALLSRHHRLVKVCLNEIKAFPKEIKALPKRNYGETKAFQGSSLTKLRHFLKRIKALPKRD
jgi:hypothetical protein